MRQFTDTYNGHKIMDILAINNGGYYIDVDHCLKGPKITTKLIPESKSQPTIQPRANILHTQAASSKASNLSIWNLVNTAAWNTEPHIIGPDEFGFMIQCVPFNIRADSQGPANRYLLNGIYYGDLSWETQDEGAATLNKTPWNWPQLESLIPSLVATCFWYQFSCGPVGWYLGSGISQHNAFSEWSKTAHSCPGTARTIQMDGIRQQVANVLIKVYQECGETCPGM